MSRLTIHERNTKCQARCWVVMLFAVFSIVGSLFHSELPVTGFAQTNEAYASSVKQGAAMQMKVHLPGRHAPDGKLPGQTHNQFADCAGGCGPCGPVHTVDVAHPNTLLMPAGPARQAGMPSRTTAPLLRPPIFQA